MILIGSELMIGLLLIKGIFRRTMFFCTLFFLTFFLFLTFFTAVSGKFYDCGCFGSVMPTSPWISFVKNFILILLLIFTYPFTKQRTPFKYSDFFVCLCLTLLLCFSSAFNQPLVDSSKYRVGDNLYINSENLKSIDVDFIPYQEFKLSEFGIIHNLNDKSSPELIESLNKISIKPIVITSMAPKEVDYKLYEHVIVGFMDNSILNNLISTDFGIITLDDNATIIQKWQKDYLGLQVYNQRQDKGLSFVRITYLLTWITIFVWSIYLITISIKRECRKTRQRVGKIKKESL